MCSTVQCPADWMADLNIHSDIPFCSVPRHVPTVLHFASPSKSGTKGTGNHALSIPFWGGGYCLIPPFVLLLSNFWHTRMYGLPPLFIIVFGSMGGKSEHSEIPAHHGRLPAGVLPFTVSAKSVFFTRQQIPVLIFESPCCLSFVKSGFHCGNDIFEGKWWKKCLNTNVKGWSLLGSRYKASTLVSIQVILNSYLCSDSF